MPRYDFAAMNQLALNDSGHFVFLSRWQYVACLSIMEQASSLYLWADDQHPLSELEIDDLSYQLAEVQYQLMSPVLGLIMAICTEIPPANTILCDGSIYQRADYPGLYAALDPGLRIDADSFTVPDLRDRFILGSGPINGAYTQGGEAAHEQTIAEMPNHAHATDAHSHTEVTAVPALITIGPGAPAAAAVPGAGLTGAAIVTVKDTGGSDPFPIMPPFYALKYVVVAL
jgi:microcystin-dependent protein